MTFNEITATIKKEDVYTRVDDPQTVLAKLNEIERIYRMGNTEKAIDELCCLILDFEHWIAEEDEMENQL